MHVKTNKEERIKLRDYRTTREALIKEADENRRRRSKKNEEH